MHQRPKVKYLGNSLWVYPQVMYWRYCRRVTSAEFTLALARTVLPVTGNVIFEKVRMNVNMDSRQY